MSECLLPDGRSHPREVRFSRQALAILSLCTVAGLDLAQLTRPCRGLSVTAAVICFRGSRAASVRHFPGFAAPLLVVVPPRRSGVRRPGHHLNPPMVRLAARSPGHPGGSHRATARICSWRGRCSFRSLGGLHPLDAFRRPGLPFALLAIGLLYVVNLLESSGEKKAGNRKTGRIHMEGIPRLRAAILSPRHDHARSPASSFSWQAHDGDPLRGHPARPSGPGDPLPAKLAEAGLSGFSDVVRSAT